LLLPKQEQELQVQMLHGLTTVLRPVVHKDIMRLEIIVSNAQLHSSLTQLITNVNHAHKDIILIQLLQDVNAQFHVLLQDQLTQQIINANAQLIQKEHEEFLIPKTTFVIVHQTFHCGTENIALCAQLEQSMTHNKDNVIIAQKDLLETIALIIVFQDFERNDRFIECCIEIIFLGNKLVLFNFDAYLLKECDS
jgi:hypothetical protein